eukprot:SAG31_NODE_2155_length_6311_cov_3.139086_1_plen_418_part_00
MLRPGRTKTAAAAATRIGEQRLARLGGHIASVASSGAASETNWLAAERKAALAEEPSGCLLTEADSTDLLPMDSPPGKRWGRIQIPFSDNRAGWGNKFVPVCIVNGENRPGPGEHGCALLMAGNHGDEYEPEISLMKLAREVDAKHVKGRLIIIPVLSIDAAKAFARCWPEGSGSEGANFNRCFPGEAGGDTASKLAHYVSHFLFPDVDVVFDLHTGGNSMAMFPCSHMHLVPDDAQRKAMLEAMLAFLTDTVFVYMDVAGNGLLPVEAERQGKVVITTELGGGGVCPKGNHSICVRGVWNCLRHLGLLVDQPPMTRASLGLAPTVAVAAADRQDYVPANTAGFWEQCVDAGDDVEVGQLLGRIHYPETPHAAPEEYHAHRAGYIIATRAITPTRPGDVVVVLAKRTTPERLVVGKV